MSDPVINKYGDQYWRNADGQYHREDGPALIYAAGDQYWYLNGGYHREDGPAIINADGTQIWILNGGYHREDGPAIIYPDGRHSWWLNDNIIYSNSHFQEKSGITDEDMTVMILRYGNVK